MQLCGTIGKRFCLVIVQVSWDTELFTLLELYLGDGQDMADHSVLALREDTAQPLLRSSRTHFFELVEFYSEDDLEMATLW